jgi:hypothetical protein
VAAIDRMGSFSFSDFQSVTRPLPTQGETVMVDTSPVRRFVEGVQLRVYGHSFTPLPGFYCTKFGGEWASRLAIRLGVVQKNFGQSSTRMIEMAAAAIGNAFPGGGGDRSIPAAFTGIIALQCELNDLIQPADPSVVGLRNGFQNALRSFLAAATANARVEDSVGRISGTWSTLADGRLSGGACRYTTQPGAYVEFDIYASTASVYVATVANDAATSPTGTFQVSVDGVAQGSPYVGAGQMLAFASAAGGGTYTFSPSVVKVDVPNVGWHTIRITKSDASTLPIYIDGVFVPSLNPPIVLVCKDPSPTSPPAQANLPVVFSKNAPTYNAIIDSVVAEFPSAHVVDLAPGWNGVTMAGFTDPSRLHPNDVGMAFIADQVEASLESLITDFKPGVSVL